jgi:hypothetical protein
MLVLAHALVKPAHVGVQISEEVHIRYVVPPSFIQLEGVMRGLGHVEKHLLLLLLIRVEPWRLHRSCCCNKDVPRAHMRFALHVLVEDRVKHALHLRATNIHAFQGISELLPALEAVFFLQVFALRR